jgi:hypothetical protein
LLPAKPVTKPIRKSPIPIPEDEASDPDFTPKFFRKDELD